MTSDFLEGSAERDARMLAELKALFEFASPREIVRSMLDLYFHSIITSETPELPRQDELVQNFYFLIKFLNHMEDLLFKVVPSPKL